MGALVGGGRRPVPLAAGTLDENPESRESRRRVDKGRPGGQNKKAWFEAAPATSELNSFHSCPSGGTGRRAAFACARGRRGGPRDLPGRDARPGGPDRMRQV